MKYRVLIGMFVSTLLLPHIALAKAKRILHVVEQSSATVDYVTTVELHHLKEGAKMGIERFKKTNPMCTFDVQYDIRKATPLELFEAARKLNDQNKIVSIGISRSTYALTYAKGLTGKNVTAISIGAATQKLKSLNNHVYSMANVSGTFIKTLSEYILSCTSNCSLGSLVDSESLYGREFDKNLRLNLENVKKIKVYSPIYYSAKNSKSTLENLDLKKLPEILFLPNYFEPSQPILAWLLKSGYSGTILGSGDWGYFQKELTEVLKQYPQASAKIIYSKSWMNGENKKSTAFEKAFEKKHKDHPSASAIYAHDAAIIALSLLCSDDSSLSLERHWNKQRSHLKNYLIRDYENILDNHFESPISLAEIKGGNIKKVNF